MPTTKLYTPGNIIQGPADIYIDVKAPPSAVPPVQGTNSWAASGTYSVDASGQPADNNTTGGISGVAVNAGGTGYTVGDVLTAVQAGASGGKLRVSTVNAGAVTGLQVLQGGVGYSVATGLATTGGTGTGCTVNITSILAGFHVGVTEGPAVLSTAPKFEEIRADQFAAPVDAAFVSLETEIDLIVKEAVLANLQKFFSSPLGTYTNVPAGATNPAADFLQIGSPSSSAATLRTLLLIAPDRAAAGNFWIVQAYKAALKSAVAFEFQRGKEMVWKLKFVCIADTARVAKDQVLQVVRII